MNSNIDKPTHYQQDGRKECIVEMLETYGFDAVKTFCELNSYKYRYRAENKNGFEDLQKAAWYDGFRHCLEIITEVEL